MQKLGQALFYTLVYKDLLLLLSLRILFVVWNFSFPFFKWKLRLTVKFVQNKTQI